jgi:hypothetical protein
MRTFMNYSACWRSKKVLVSTSDITPLISGQHSVEIVSSVIAKISNSSKCWTIIIQAFWMTLLFISACCYYLLPVICCSTFCSVLIRFSIQCLTWFFCSVFVLFRKCSVMILEMCSRHFDPINNNHLQSMNIIHQTAPSFVLVQYRSEWPITIIDIEGDIWNQYSPSG